MLRLIMLNWLRKLLHARVRVGLTLILGLSMAVNIYQWRLAGHLQKTRRILHSNDASTIKNIEGYLDSVSKPFVEDVQSLAKQYDVPSWGCGPSSYALAKIINKRFFNDQLRIDATYNGEAYEIVERFSFVQTYNTGGVDHAWLEIYLGDKMLFIDPTIGQFGKIKGIAYEEFNVGDSTIGTTLHQNFDIVDDRLLLLVQKAVNRVPKDQNPYPGAAISPQQLDYYLAAAKDREIVNGGGEPDSWIGWVNQLSAKYGQ